MKKIKICTFAILLMMTVFMLSACSRKDSGAGQGTNPSSTQSTSGTNESKGNTSNSTNGNTGSTNTQESTSGSSSSDKNRDGDEEESSTGVIGGMMDDVEKGVDDMLNGNDASAGSDENK